MPSGIPLHMARIGIVGVEGFIGSALSVGLGKGGHEIHGFSRVNKITDPGEMAQVRENLDFIIWSASLTNPGIAEKRPDLVKLEHEEWKAFLRTVSKQTFPRLKVIFLSSGGCVYSGKGPVFFENDAAEGNNSYGKLKSEMESELIQSGISYTILRVANIYGPGQPIGRGQGVIAEWVELARQLKPINVYGELGTQRDFLFLSDFVSAVQKVIGLKGNEILNIGSGQGSTLKRVLDALESGFSNSLTISYHSARTFDRSSYWLDINLAKEKLEWDPVVALESGIRKCLYPEGSVNDLY